MLELILAAGIFILLCAIYIFLDKGEKSIEERHKRFFNKNGKPLK